MKYLNQYNDIMTKYKQGEYGNENLSMYDILNKANGHDIIDGLNLSEIQNLLDSASGITRKMFSILKQSKERSVAHMKALEDELEDYGIDTYRKGEDMSDTALAQNLNLLVKYCSDDELPKDTEAMLCPVDDPAHFGVIKIQKECAMTSFSFRHEIIHYFRDVKVGNCVTVELARKMKGKTPNDEEQEVNYLTAASIMPLEKISEKLAEFESIQSKKQEKAFLSDLAKEYEQDENAVLRRIVEVRCLVDYMQSVKN